MTEVDINPRIGADLKVGRQRPTICILLIRSGQQDGFKPVNAWVSGMPTILRLFFPPLTHYAGVQRHSLARRDPEFLQGAQYDRKGVCN